MGRKNPIAAVYKLTNKQNGKIYIGESTNIVDRMSHYRTVSRGRGEGGHKTSRPMDRAMIEYGFDGFDVELLASSETDPRVVEDDYRKELEYQYITKLNAADPNVGYNSVKTKSHIPGKRNYKGHKHTIYTRMLKSDPVICVDGEEAMLYWSAQSCAKLLGITDRSIVIRCIHKGISNHGRYFFKLSFAGRMDDALRIIAHKKDDGRKRDNGFAAKTLIDYVRALNVANDWCVKYGFATVDIDKLMI